MKGEVGLDKMEWGWEKFLHLLAQMLIERREELQGVLASINGTRPTHSESCGTECSTAESIGYEIKLGWHQARCATIYVQYDVEAPEVDSLEGTPASITREESRIM